LVTRPVTAVFGEAIAATAPAFSELPPEVQARLASALSSTPTVIDAAARQRREREMAARVTVPASLIREGDRIRVPGGGIATVVAIDPYPAVAPSPLRHR
jgi:hypothetical protein